MLADRETLRDFGPLAERAVSIEPESLIRFRTGPSGIGGYVRLPFEVLAGRTLQSADLDRAFDSTVSARQFLTWLDGDGGEPTPADAHWLSALPPRTGWRRVELVPDTAVREVVRSGALLARDTGSRSGQQALLDAIVLTVQSADQRIEVPLSALSALTRMGFLPRGGEAAVDTAPGWIRVAAAYGSTYVSDGKPLGLLSL